MTRLRASATLSWAPPGRPGPLHNSAAPGPEVEECGREEAEQDTALSPAAASPQARRLAEAAARPLGSPDWSWEEKTKEPKSHGSGDSSCSGSGGFAPGRELSSGHDRHQLDRTQRQATVQAPLETLLGPCFEPARKPPHHSAPHPYLCHSSLSNPSLCLPSDWATFRTRFCYREAML